ncbi:uncharacterized protein LOC124111474 [Haliotis rufescens]|uniref:uncharacterized protein LOC124111474 n=1 Tax=Haliotis rufescens TaxID=6454 RepID=UPI00201F4C18|nr:uncharacterized protein LOC124111474 [Haliotis rufescens]
MESVLSLVLLCACAFVCSGAVYNQYPSYGQQYRGQYVPNNYQNNHYPADVWGGHSQGHYKRYRRSVPSHGNGYPSYRQTYPSNGYPTYPSHQPSYPSKHIPSYPDHVNTYPGHQDSYQQGHRQNQWGSQTHNQKHGAYHG